MEGEKKEKVMTEKEVLAKYLPGETVSTMAEAIDLATDLSFELKELEARLDKYKALSRGVFSPSEQVSGKTGFVLVTPAKVTDVESADLHQLLKDVERGEEFYHLIKVKIADARKALGTTLFSKISTESPGVPRVKFGRLERVK